MRTMLMRMKSAVIVVLVVGFSLCGTFPAQADNDPLTALNDAFLTAIREHRTRDALVLLKKGATARIRGFARHRRSIRVNGTHVFSTGARLQ